jgi:hypothetical protein
MKFKSFEIFVNLASFNSSMFAIEKKADGLVNEWLQANPNVQIEHFSQSLAELNGAIVYQVGMIYSER